MSHRDHRLGMPVAPRNGTVRPLGLQDVRVTGGHWGRMQVLNRDVVIPHVEHWLERAGWLANFDLAASGGPMTDRQGREFADSEAYKLLEAMAWELGREPDVDLERRYRALVDRVAAAQEPDGYLNTNFGRPGQAGRWTDLAWGHELYCIGHLLQAAVARARTGHGEDRIVEVAIRAADLVCAVFGPDGLEAIDGHPEIEPALVELYRVTGEERYLVQAELFLDRRGRGLLPDIEFGPEYFLDDVPVREATVLRGHAVRAVYLAAGAVDLADELGDPTLLKTIGRQWAATLGRRTYVTGGMGSRHQDEAFGEDFSLPPDRAYSETCAGIGSVMLAWRLLLAGGDPVHADTMERTLLNVIAASPAADGRSFFYANTLHRREEGAVPAVDRPSLRAGSSLRAPWFEVSCCPTNLARMLASLGCYLATADEHGVQVHQVFEGTVRHRLPDGREVGLGLETDYPADGRLVVTVEVDEDRPWSLSLRVPGWARDGASVGINDEPSVAVRPGLHVVRRTWVRGDRVVLSLPVEPRFTFPDDRIDAVRGCLAVEHGPSVMALESVDVPGGGSVDALHIDASTPPRLVDGRVVVRLQRTDPLERPWPYHDGQAVPERGGLEDVPLVAYRDWANRGPSTMRVWMPIAPTGAE